MVAQLLKGRFQAHRIAHGKCIEHLGRKFIQVEHWEKVKPGHDEVGDSDCTQGGTAKHPTAPVDGSCATTHHSATGKHDQGADHHKPDANKAQNR